VGRGFETPALNAQTAMVFWVVC